MVSARWLRVLEGPAACHCAEILHLQLLVEVSKVLVLLAEGDVLSLHPLQVLDPHLQLVLVVLQLALVVLPHNLHLLLQLLLVACTAD